MKRSRKNGEPLQSENELELVSEHGKNSPSPGVNRDILRALQTKKGRNKLRMILSLPPEEDENAYY